MDIHFHFKRIEERLKHVLAQLSSPEVAGQQDKLRELNREHSRLAPAVAKYHAYQSALKERDDLKSLIGGSDDELRKMAQDDIGPLEERIEAMNKELLLSLLPRDPNEDRNVLLEIRAGTGGDEAGLFAGDLLRMYSRYAEAHRWTIEPLSMSLGERGSVKEAVIEISGESVWKHFKFESGVHRVQRVPATEANGRIHTSTATVAVMAEAEEVDVDINPADLRIDTFRASGAGGQHINKTDSAVRITHIPTGFFVACQEERSQIKNRAKAMRLLRSRLLEMAQEKQNKEIAQTRKQQIGTGDRSEKIRTYNFPQDRLTDHRINLSLHNLPNLMEGKLDELIAQLLQEEQSQQLKDLMKEEGNA